MNMSTIFTRTVRPSLPQLAWLVVAVIAVYNLVAPPLRFQGPAGMRWVVGSLAAVLIILLFKTHKHIPHRLRQRITKIFGADTVGALAVLTVFVALFPLVSIVVRWMDLSEMWQALVTMTTCFGFIIWIIVSNTWTSAVGRHLLMRVFDVGVKEADREVPSGDGQS